MRTDILDRKNDIINWIKENKSKSFICKELNCRQSTLNSYLEKMNIKYSGNKGLKGKIAYNKKMAIDYLTENSLVTNNHLKKKLYDEKIKEQKCEKCEIRKWNNIEISFELHHINGNRFDNRLLNLKILCPNCHSQTTNYSGKKLKIYKKIKKVQDKINYCRCGEIIENKSNMCIGCYSITQRKIKIRPTHEQLLVDVKELNYTNTGKKYGVSDNTIRKWIKNIPK